jgi:heat shock protein HslJ
MSSHRQWLGRARPKSVLVGASNESGGLPPKSSLRAPERRNRVRVLGYVQMMHRCGLIVAVACLGACGEPAAETTSSVAPAPIVVDVSETTGGASGTQPTVLAPPTTTVTTVSELPSQQGIGDKLEGTWRAISGTVNGVPVALIEGIPVTMTYDGSHVTGTAACNEYRYENVVVAGHDVELGRASVNAMGCEPRVASIEDAFLGSFGPQAWFEVEEGLLVWRTPTATWIFERVVPAPDAAIVGTVWILESVLYEFGLMATPWIGDARIEFADGGAVTGSSGCRDFAASWSLSEGTIQVDRVEIAGTCEGERAEVDGIVARVLDEGFTASVDGVRLLARPHIDLGLDYRAAP